MPVKPNMVVIFSLLQVELILRNETEFLLFTQMREAFFFQLSQWQMAILCTYPGRVPAVDFTQNDDLCPAVTRGLNSIVPRWRLLCFWWRRGFRDAEIRTKWFQVCACFE